MSTRTIRVGFIGAGSVSNRHAEAYKTVPNAKVVAVSDLVESLANQKKVAWGAEKAYTDYHQMLRDADIDVVNVCTPNGYHPEQVIAAAEAGKHVLVEKPMANSVKECDDMIAAAKRNHVKLQIGHNLVFFPLIEEAKRLVDTGIGMPIVITSRRNSAHLFGGWRADSKVNAGFLMEACVHQFIIARFFMGEFKRVSCTVAKTSDKASYDDQVVVANWEFENNRYGTLTANQGGPAPFSLDPVEVIGSEGGVFVPGIEQIYTPGAPLTHYRDGAYTQYVRRNPRAAYAAPSKYAVDDVCYNSFNYEMQHFIDCVVNDKTPRVTGEDGRKVMQAVLACYESSRDGRRVTLSP